MLAVEKHKATFLAPVGIGLALFIAEIAGVYYTGGSLNPARSFGPCVANHSFPDDHWVYWVGPLLGALVAAGFYWFIKAVEFQTANPGQDFDDLEANAFDPTTDLSRPVVSPNAVVDRTEAQDLAAINQDQAPRNSSLGSPNRARAEARNSTRTDGTFDTRTSEKQESQADAMYNTMSNTRNELQTDGMHNTMNDTRSGTNGSGGIYNSVTISSPPGRDGPPRL